MNLNVYFDNIVSRYADRVATVFNDRMLTYRELGERAGRLAAALTARGLRPGASVSMICGNSDIYMEIVFGCARAGVVTEQLNCRLGAKTLAQLIGASESTLLFVSFRYLDLARRAVAEVPRSIEIVVVDDQRGLRGEGYEALLKSVSCPVPAHRARDEDAFTMLYTSGTTGLPKGVLHSHRSVVASTLQAIVETGWSGDDVVLYVLPMFHVSLSAAYCTLFCGGRLVILERFDPQTFPRAVARHGATRAGLVPQMVRRLADDARDDSRIARALDPLKAVVYAGAPMPTSALREAERTLSCSFYALYGMTETMGAVALLTPDDHARLMARPEAGQIPVGRPALGFDIRVVDAEGLVCAVGEVGEIVVRGDSLMLGYDDVELTEKVMLSRAYRTGDIGFFDEEGYISVVDRKNDMIISGGENVYPSEVESCIRSIGEDVLDVVVVGIPDETWGQAVAAAIVLRKGAAITEADIVRQCGEAIGSYKKPRKIVFYEQLPFNDCGKVDRQAIALQMRDGL